jgi:hypothetical protein
MVTIASPLVPHEHQDQICFGSNTAHLGALSVGGQHLDLDLSYWDSAGNILFAFSLAPYTSHDHTNVLNMPGNTQAIADAVVENDRRRRQYCSENGIPFLELRGSLNNDQRRGHINHVLSTGEVRVVSATNVVYDLPDTFNIPPQTM